MTFNLFLRFLICATFLIFSGACKKKKPKPQSNSINKILPLGASRAAGKRPDYESFRYELWKDLIENDWTFDFIGTRSDNSNYPEYDGQSFDIDHEGRGGWTSGQILEGLDARISETGAPDIVLFSSPGGNDALQELPYENVLININAIIDVLQASNPNVTILIEQLAPGKSAIMTPELTTYFNQLHEDVMNIALEKSTASSQIVTIDMYTGFTEDMLADNIHYNEIGAEFIATRYYTSLVSYLEE